MIRKQKILEWFALAAYAVFAGGVLLTIFRAPENPTLAAALAALASVIIALSSFMFNYIFSRKGEGEILYSISQRYSTDRNIKKVVKWIAANLDDNGLLRPNEQLNRKYIPCLYEKEIFVAFFEDIYYFVKNESISRKSSIRHYSYYAIKFDEYDFFHSDISAYDTQEWNSFHRFVNMMKKIT